MAQWPLEREPLPSYAVLQRTARRQSPNQCRSFTKYGQTTSTLRSSKRGIPRILTDKCEAMISGFHAFPGEAEPSVLAKVNGSVRQYFSPVCTRRSAGPCIHNSILDLNRVLSKDQPAFQSRAICIARSWVAGTAWYAGLTEILGEGCM